MTQPQPPNLFIARISGPLEFFSIAVYLIGILFKLQSWPYATEMLLIGGLGLCVSYLVLFPMRLFALRSILPRNDFNYAMAAGISIGLFVASIVLSLVTKVFFWTPALSFFLDAIRITALVGVVGTFIYDYIRTHPMPNTAQFMIALWIRKRQQAIAILLIIGLLFRFLL